MWDHSQLWCRTESVRTRALQTAMQAEEEFLEYARAFHQTEAPTHPPQTTTINEESPSGLVIMELNALLCNWNHKRANFTRRAAWSS